jgi:hypothetical protein
MKKNHLFLLTTTGGRPFAWSLCQRMMEAQTFRGEVTWIIVDDCMSASQITISRSWSLEICRPRPFWSEGQNTQVRNLRAGLAAVPPDGRVVIIEDDDWYAPEYLEAVHDWLLTHDLVGECQARYYNVATRRYGLCRNSEHASLCSTAVKGTGLLALRHVVANAADFVDVDLWETVRRSRSACAIALHQTDYVVGIKGLPGRHGIGIGHTPEFGTQDPDGAVLRGWVGNEFAAEYFGAIR